MQTILIIGLGNPGKEYAATRHNFGFLFLDHLAKNLGNDFEFSLEKKLKSEIIKAKIGENQLILAKPQTFVNLSGEAVIKLRNFFKPDILIVAYDDLNLDFGTIRLRNGGQSGGHNGIKNIIRKLGDNFWRLKLGIGPQPKINERLLKAEDFVLQKFAKDEQTQIPQILDKAATEIAQLIEKGNLEEKTIK